MDKNKKRIIISAVSILVMVVVVGILIVEKRKQQAANVLTIPPINNANIPHDYAAVPSAKADATLFFDNAKVWAKVGDDFNLTTRVDPGSNTEKGINAVELDATFDPAILQLSKVTVVAPFAEIGAPLVDNKKGTLSAAFFITGSQVNAVSDVATLSFNAKGIADNSTVSLANSSQAAVNDGNGTMVLGTRTGSAVNVAK